MASGSQVCIGDDCGPRGTTSHANFHPNPNPNPGVGLDCGLVVPQVMLAMSEIYANTSILPGLRMKMKWYDYYAYESDAGMFFCPSNVSD